MEKNICLYTYNSIFKGLSVICQQKISNKSMQSITNWIIIDIRLIFPWYIPSLSLSCHRENICSLYLDNFLTTDVWTLCCNSGYLDIRAGQGWVTTITMLLMSESSIIYPPWPLTIIQAPGHLSEGWHGWHVQMMLEVIA